MATPDQIPSDLALEIDEDLPAAEFVSAARHFFGFVEDVSKSSTPDGRAVKWAARVREGSAVLAAMAPASAPPEILQSVYARTTRAIDALTTGDVEGARLTEVALGHLRALSGLRAGKGRPAGARLWVRRTPMVLGPEIARAIEEDWRADYNDYGTVEGRLEVIQDHGALQIRVKDAMLRQTVRCYLPDELLSQALENFRNRVEVSGQIHYRRNGSPISIEASRIEALPSDDELPTADEVRGILAGYA